MRSHLSSSDTRRREARDDGRHYTRVEPYESWEAIVHAHPDLTQSLQEPPLRWAGARARLAHAIVPHLGNGHRLVEPFAGSASVWLNSDFPHALLADNNPHLIGFYETVREGPGVLIDAARPHFEAEAAWSAPGFRERCQQFDRGGDPHTQAALLLYITHFGLNGLLRFDTAGHVTTPFGGRAVRPALPVDAVHACAEKAQRTTTMFRAQDFRQTFTQLERGDVVYCDPGPLNAHPDADTGPYAPNTGGLTEADHRALVEGARAAAARGIPVTVSIRDNGRARALHQHATELIPIAVPPALERRTRRAAAADLLALYRQGV